MINKKIILIAPCYFNYYKLIISALEQRGNIVDFLKDENSGLLYNVSRKSSFLTKKYLNLYKKEVVRKLVTGSYDIMIVIGGKTLDSDFWKLINKTYNFKKVLYQWDSIRNFDYREMIDSFDIVKTFDSEDAKELGIAYLPLFYKRQSKKTVAEDLDLMFVGIWHSDRIEILHEISNYADANNLKYIFKVYHPWYVYFYMVYIKNNLKKSPFFIHHPIPPEETISYYDRAKCIVDINHPWQSGMTMRTIETVGKGKKLITTNSFIQTEDFFDPMMIQVIDRKNIKINSDFFSFQNDYKNIDTLEINNWVTELLK